MTGCDGHTYIARCGLDLISPAPQPKATTQAETPVGPPVKEVHPWATLRPGAGRPSGGGGPIPRGGRQAAEMVVRGKRGEAPKVEEDRLDDLEESA